MPIILSKRPGGTGGGGAPSGPAGGDLTGTYPNPDIAANSVETAMIQDDAIDNDKIGNNAVDTPQLVDDSVDADKIDGADASDIRTVIGVASADGWVNDAAATWTRTADQTFTVTGDRTAVFTKGTRLRWTQTTVKYGTVVGSSHAAGTTTVTIATTTDYVLTAAAISVNSYSYAANPSGYPTWFAYTPTYGGFSAAPPSTTARFSISGAVCTVVLVTGNGTSNATNFTLTLPMNYAIANTYGSARVTNNGTNAAALGVIFSDGGTNVVSVYRDGSGLAWTASGNKACIATYTFEF